MESVWSYLWFCAGTLVFIGGLGLGALCAAMAFVLAPIPFSLIRLLIQVWFPKLWGHRWFSRSVDIAVFCSTLLLLASFVSSNSFQPFTQLIACRFRLFGDEVGVQESFGALRSLVTLQFFLNYFFLAVVVPSLTAGVIEYSAERRRILSPSTRVT